ncbi:LOW QUALITY PROTEIN: uncharacterized protein LOC119416524 [Nematolebias whitei]|uniref:LOW QUALITY PROTEIN: uncharacterized protein LOC119416524 n=1 Tax=Nematolebias whitei TaxID=451745 RepID=UPI00189A5FD9|nr:LOW QUALITY PROTEIN: uncharacterized protein LOC119416524 [Nematolebias whitei]
MVDLPDVSSAKHLSSVTRLHLLSQTLLNSAVRQKQHSFSLTLTRSLMDFVEWLRPSEACSLLTVPSLSSLDVDEEEGEDIIIGIRPKSSPIPSRKSSFTDEDSEAEPPPLCGSRRVSFADAKGLSLVQVKEFDTKDVPKRPGFDSAAVDVSNTMEYFLLPLTFSLPLPSDELSTRVLEQKIELETIELLTGTTILKGVVRVLNISYIKSVYVRTTFDNWCNHFDLLAEYIPDTSGGVMDSFLFKLTLVPPFRDQATRVDFCLRYETPVGTFWANNNNKNYVLFYSCRMKEEKEKGQRETVNKKSCLKTVNPSVSADKTISLKPSSSLDSISSDESTPQLEGDRTAAQKAPESLLDAPKEEEQKLLMESRQSSSQQRQRKAAQMARVRDYLAQRDQGVSDRNNPSSGIKQMTWVENLKDKHGCVQEKSEPECHLFVSEAHKTCSQPVYNHTCSKQPEKPDSAELARGECATDLPNERLHSADQDATTEEENPRGFLTKTQHPDMSVASMKNTAAGLAGLVGHSNSSTRLYHQGFSGALAENPNGKSPVNTPVNNHPFKIKENCDIASKNTKSNTSNLKRNVSENLDLDNRGPMLTTFNDTNMLQCADTVQKADLRDPDASQSQQHLSADASEHLGMVNSVLVKDFLSPHAFSESMLLQEIATGQKLTLDLSRGITADPQEWTCEPLLTSEKSPAGKTDTVSKMFQSKQTTLKGGNERKNVSKNDDAHNNVAFTKIYTVLNPPPNNNIVSKSGTNELVSLCGPEKINLTSPEICQQENNSIEEIKYIMSPQKGDKNNSVEVKAICEPAGFVIRNQNGHAEKSEGPTDENHPDKMKYCVAEAVILKEDETVRSTDNTWVKSYDTVVEEKENSTVTSEEEDELLTSKAENKKAMEKDTSQRIEEKIVEKGADDKVHVDKVDTMAVIKGMVWLSEDETAMILVDKETKLEDVGVFMAKKNTDEDKTQTAMQALHDFLEMQQVSTEKKCVQDEEEMEKNMNMSLNYDGETDEKQENQRETHQEKIDYRDEILADETAATNSCVAGDEDGWSEEMLAVAENKAEDGLSALLSSELEVMKESTKDGSWILTETLLFEHAKHGSTEPLALENVLTDKLESDQVSHSSSSAESNSDDEVELYMHCLRAAGASTQARKDMIKDAGFTVSKGKLLLQPMPLISESLDEGVPLSDHLEKPEDMQKTETGGQDNTSQGVQRYKETFLCCSLSKAPLYFALLVIFLVVAHRYDFLACFGLYLLSIIWLCCQGEREPGKHSDKAG